MPTMRPQAQARFAAIRQLAFPAPATDTPAADAGAQDARANIVQLASGRASGRGMNQVDRNWERQLNNAVAKNMHEVLDRLLARGAYLPADGVNMKQQALHRAIGSRQVLTETVRQLVEAGASVAGEGVPEASAPMSCAVREGRVDIARYFLDILKPSPNALCHLALGGKNSAAMLELLLDRAGADVHSPDQEGNPLLHAAAACGDLGALLFLLQRQEKFALHPDQRNDFDDGALSLAVENRHPEAARLLLSHGADAAAIGVMDKTPLHHAVEAGDTALAEALLTAPRPATGVLLHADVWGDSPLSLAIRGKDHAMLDLLLKHFSTPDFQDPVSGATLLHLGANTGDARICRLLLQRYAALGGHADGVDHEGRTALHLAAKNGHNPALAEFLDCRKLLPMDVNALDGEQRTALDHAVAGGNAVAVEILLKGGANPYLYGPGINAASPLYNAVSLGHLEIARQIAGSDFKLRHALGHEGQAAQWLERGREKAGAGNAGEALKDFEKAALLAPDNPVPLLLQMLVLEQQDDWEGARLMGERLLALASGADKVIALAGQCLRFDYPEGALSILLNHRPVEDAVVARWCELMDRSGQLEQKRQGLEELIAAAPRNARVWGELAHTCLTLEQLPEAKNAYEYALRFQPDSMEYLAAFAGLCEVLGDFGRARELLENLLAISPADPVILPAYERVCRFVAHQATLQ